MERAEYMRLAEQWAAKATEIQRDGIPTGGSTSWSPDGEVAGRAAVVASNLAVAYAQLAALTADSTGVPRG